MLYNIGLQKAVPPGNLADFNQQAIIMKKYQQQIKTWLWFFIIVLFLSGATAIPAAAELSFVVKKLQRNTPLSDFLSTIEKGVLNTQSQFPFLFYGYDWLAFAHFVLAILFTGPLRNPVRNRWVIEFGMIACLLIILFAMIAGYYRGIPFWWKLIDCSFGVAGIIPLYLCYTKIQKLETLTNKISDH
jgi:hypothetical protein